MSVATVDQKRIGNVLDKVDLSIISAISELSLESSIKAQCDLVSTM